jgi:hypothetical protein
MGGGGKKKLRRILGLGRVLWGEKQWWRAEE